MYEFGTIILTPFPFMDLSSAKVRPALIVSKKPIGDDVIVCYITSKIPDHSAQCILLDPNEQNGLKTKSAVRLEKIATLSKRVILGEIGSVEQGIVRKHAAQFHGVFGF